MTILVTGGIGSGKSMVCHFMEQRGVPVYDSDTEAKQLYDRCPELVAEVAAKIGEEVLDGNGKIDRKALGAAVFSDPEKLKVLESIIHPAVYRDFDAFRSANADAPMVVFESAIILQRGIPEGFADEVVYVDAPLETRVARAAKRDGRPVEEIMKRVAAQPSIAEDPRITRVMVNDGSLEDLERATEELLIILKTEYNENRSR